MIKLLHSADWHLDAPFQGRTQAQQTALRKALLEIPGKLAELCREEDCDLCLLSGDLFDGNYTAESYRVLYDALKEMAVPVFIAPGNHDFAGINSPWLRESWPENVHIFTKPQVESVAVPSLSCRVYGAGFTSMDCPALLENFRARQAEKYAIGIFHGDPVQRNSPYNPITRSQIAGSKLNYLALGHVHKGDSFREGDTLCAGPGCPMGRGYDEQGVKGVYIVTVEEKADCRFVPLNTPRFYDLETQPQELPNLLPAVGSDDFYRITLTGSCEAPDMDALKEEYKRFANLVLRDKTRRPEELWGSAGEDSFEGLYFALLKKKAEAGDESAQLAARLSRQILMGEEAEL